MAHIDHKQNFTHTLASVQRRLSPASRTFSQFIHTPLVETVSEVLEKTVARPSVLLGATATAFLGGSAVYMVARHYGYSLSGAELPCLLLAGGLLGLILEGFVKLIKRR